MSEKVGEIYVEVGADVSPVQKALDDVADTFKSFEGDVTDSGKELSSAWDGWRDKINEVGDTAKESFEGIEEAAKQTEETVKETAKQTEKVWDNADRGSKKFMGGLRDLSETVSNVVLGLSIIPGVMDETTKKYAGMAVVGINVAIGIGTAVQAITDLREGAKAAAEAMKGIDIASKMSALTTPWGIAAVAIGAVVTALVAVELKTHAISNAWAGFSAQIKGTTDAWSVEIERAAGEFDKWAHSMQGNVLNLGDMFDQMLRNQFGLFGDLFSQWTKSGEQINQQTEETNRLMQEGLTGIKEKIGATESQWAELEPIIKKNESAVIAFAKAHEQLTAAEKSLNDLQSSYNELLNAINSVEDAQYTQETAGVKAYEAQQDAATATQEYDTARGKLSSNQKKALDDVIKNGKTSVKLTKDEQGEVRRVADLYLAKATSIHSATEATNEARNADEQAKITTANLQAIGEELGLTTNDNIESYKKLAESLGQRIPAAVRDTIVAMKILNDYYNALRSNFASNPLDISVNWNTSGSPPGTAPGSSQPWWSGQGSSPGAPAAGATPTTPAVPTVPGGTRSGGIFGETPVKVDTLAPANMNGTWFTTDDGKTYYTDDSGKTWPVSKQGEVPAGAVPAAEVINESYTGEEVSYGNGENKPGTKATLSNGQTMTYEGENRWRLDSGDVIQQQGSQWYDSSMKPLDQSFWQSQTAKSTDETSKKAAQASEEYGQTVDKSAATVTDSSKQIVQATTEINTAHTDEVKITQQTAKTSIETIRSMGAGMTGSLSSFGSEATSLMSSAVQQMLESMRTLNKEAGSCAGGLCGGGGLVPALQTLNQQVKNTDTGGISTSIAKINTSTKTLSEVTINQPITINGPFTKEADLDLLKKKLDASTRKAMIQAGVG